MSVLRCAAALEAAEISSFEGFRGLREEWDVLSARSHFVTPFLTHEWLASWWRHFGEGRTMCIVTVREAGRLVAAFPLIGGSRCSAGLPLRTLCSLTNKFSSRSHYLAEPGREEEACNSLWDHLSRRARGWDCLWMGEVPEDSSGLRALLSTAAARGYRTGAWRDEDSPFIAVDTTWEEFLAGRSRKHRYNIRSRAKRLAGLGPVDYVALEQPTDADIDDALAIEAMGWKGAERSAILSSSADAAFFREWMRVFAERGWLRLTFLSSAGRRIAVEICTVYGPTMSPVKIGFNPEFSAYSPGQLLCAESLRRLFEGGFGDGVRDYDFLGKSTPQKRDWTERSRSLVWPHVYNRTVRGRLGRWAKFDVVPRVRRLRRPDGTVRPDGQPSDPA